jgi:ribonuclease Z
LTVAALRLGELGLEGWSRAGDESWFRVHPPGLALDAGRGAPELAGAGDLFLSHGHLDHALGVPFVLSQRSLHRLPPTRVFCPAPAVDDLRALIEAAARLEALAYAYELRGLAAGERVEVGRDLWVEAFAVDHGVPALGYHLVRRRRRLAAALHGLAGPEVAARRRRGEPVDEEVEELWLTYPGDTGPGVFALEPRLFASRVLLIECTFLAAEHRERGAAYRHLHLEDLVERQASFDNEAVVLVHLSRRHRPQELLRRARERLPALAARLHVFPPAVE